MIDYAALSAFFQVVLIDVTLAGDNAIVVGMVTQSLAPKDRQKALIAGIGIATLLRIGFALVATQILAIVGLTLAGGLLLLWVAWKTFRETVHARRQGHTNAGVPQKTIRQAIIQIAIADVSMSLDNALAVAGTARDHLWVLVAGLVLSVILMGAASALVSRLLQRFSGIAWVGIAIIAYVAVSMIYDGWFEVKELMPGHKSAAMLLLAPARLTLSYSALI